MRAGGTKFQVLVNGKLVADADVSVADQIEVNLASLSGQDDAVLAVTAFIPSAPKREGFVHCERAVVSPGDTVTIALTEIADCDTTQVKSQPIEPNDTEAIACSFCGKSQMDVGRLIAGPNVRICDECVLLCHKVIKDET